MQNSLIAKLISIYKLGVNLLRIILGILIINFNFDIPAGISRVTELSGYNPIITHAGRYIRGSSFLPTITLAITIIVFSLIDLIFVFGLANRKRWGALGLLINSFLWIPVEILFVSKFLVAPELIAILIDLIIIYLLYKILMCSKDCFIK